MSEQQYSAYIGSRGERGGYILAVEHFVRHGFLAADLPTGTNSLTGYGFLDFRSNFTNLARITLPNGSNVILDTSRFGPGQSSNDPSSYRTYNSTRDNYDRQRGGIFAISPATRTSVYFSGHRDLGDKTTVTLDILANRTKDRYVVGSSVTPISVPASNPYNPFGTAVVANYRLLDYGPGPYNEGQGNINSYTLNTVNAALQLGHKFTSALTLSVTANYFR